MDSKELRKRIIEKRGFTPPATHGVANYLSGMVAPGLSEEVLFKSYGEQLGCDSVVELLTAANLLKE